MKQAHGKQGEFATSAGGVLESGDDADLASLPNLSAAIPGAVVGRLVLLEGSMRALVDFPANRSGKLVPARTLLTLNKEESGSAVALLFEDGDPSRPIVLGVLRGEADPLGAVTQAALDVTLDDETLVLSAKKEIVLRCGKASITLTSAGKLLIEGEYVVSRSAGVNKIRGGSVQIN